MQSGNSQQIFLIYVCISDYGVLVPLQYAKKLMQLLNVTEGDFA